MKKTIRIITLLLVIFFFYQPLISQNKKTLVNISVKNSQNKAVKDAVFYIDDVKTEVNNRNGIYKLKIEPTTKIIKAFSYSNGVLEIEYSGQKKIDFVFPNLFKPETNKVVKKTENDTFEYNSIYDMIRSKVPGVRVESNNKIIIRGETSLQGSVEPLLIVNGSPVSTIDNISPDFVKSISVLKGPEAAIYGVRGANWVIIITLVKKIN